jgi:hypothetical protein
MGQERSDIREGARKPAPTRASTDKPSKPAAEERKAEEAPVSIAPEERRKRIAERAYYKALARGFGGGEVERDWLDAEREIDDELLNQRR